MLKFQQDESPLINDEKRAELAQDGSLANDDFLTVSSRDSAVKRGTIMLAALFAVGLAGIFFMVKKSGPSAAAAGEVNNEAVLQAAVARIAGIEKADDMEQVVNRFYELSNIEQVKVSELRKNPFVLDKSFLEQPVNVVPGETSNETASATRRRLQDQLSPFRLIGIITAPQGNMCMIDDRVMGKGDMLGDFKVVEVLDNSVVLTAQGLEFELKM